MRVQHFTRPKGIFVGALAVALMFGEWILLVASAHKDEMIVGAASVLASGAFLFVANRSNTLRTDFRPVDMVPGLTNISVADARYWAEQYRRAHYNFERSPLVH